MLKLVAGVGLAAALVAPALSQAPVPTTVAGANWTSFLGSESGTSYSSLDQVNRKTVTGLTQVWAMPIPGQIQNMTPVVVDGIMYVVMSDERVLALEAATGTVKWTWTPTNINPANRLRGSASVAVGHGLVYFGTKENHLVALDAATGREVWDVEIEDRDICSCQPSHGLLLVKDKLLVGVRGDVAHRSYINAFDARTGRHVWRWWVIPAAGEKGNETWPDYLWKLGGGATWYAGSYDPKLNLLYWGTANPQPIMGSISPFAKLWTNSIVALDVDTGKMKWGFQETPADPFDYDSASEMMLVDAPVDGKVTPLVVHATKSGQTWVFNRATGALVSAYAFAGNVNWNKGLDKAGKPIEPIAYPKQGTLTICPSYFGARAANHGAYSPKTGLWYGSSAEICSKHSLVGEPKLVEGRSYNASKEEGVLRSPEKPFIAAFDPVSGKRRWIVTTPVAHVSSLMATAGDLVFTGDMFGDLSALDAETGERLWTGKLGGQTANSPMTYMAGGRQYVAVSTGGGGAFSGVIRQLWPAEAKSFAPATSRIVVFALPGGAK